MVVYEGSHLEMDQNQRLSTSSGGGSGCADHVQPLSKTEGSDWTIRKLGLNRFGLVEDYKSLV